MKASNTSIRKAIVLDSEWNIGIKIKIPMAVTAKGFLFTRGQVDLDNESNVQNQGDALAQTRACIGHISEVLRVAHVEPAQILHINHYYRDGCIENPERFLSEIRDHLCLNNATPITLISVPHFYYDGLEVETDVIASTEGDVNSISQEVNKVGSLSVAFKGQTAFISGQLSILADFSATALLSEVATLFEGAGAKGAWGRLWLYVPVSHMENFYRIKEEVMALDSKWEIHCILCYNPKEKEKSLSLVGYAHTDGLVKHYDPDSDITILSSPDFAFVDLISVDRQCTDHALSSTEELVAQTKLVMDRIKTALAKQNLDFSHVLKATTYYVGDDGEEDLHANLGVREGYYSYPGPASTGVPVLRLDNENARIAVSLLLSV